MSKKFVIALDQGTTSCRAMLINKASEVVDIVQEEFRQIYPKPGWVEHDPKEIMASQTGVLERLLKKNKIKPEEVAALGITNQRETTVVWDKNTGEPVYNAIVWQDKRTAPICEALKRDGWEEKVKNKTGLVIDSYFSATKVKWILDEVEGARDKAETGDLIMGTMDTWLIWNLTRGQVHVTDYTNASRTMLYNIIDLQWDTELLEALSIPESMLPEVKPSSYHYGDFNYNGVSIPISGIAGDQQAALFGQACFEPGMAKNTYGTGCFMLMNTGEKPRISSHGLLTTIAWGLDGKVHYALEGSIFIAGAAVQWLRDGLKMIDSASDSEYFANKASGQDEVYLVPAFAGLGAPYWDMYARGAVFGLTRDSGKEHLVKATLESLAFQTRDILLAMEEDSGISMKTLKVDGGACANSYLMQFQADILGGQVERPEVIETTAMGAAYLAGINQGFWKQEEILKYRKIDRVFDPQMEEEERVRRYAYWKKAVERTMNWLDS